MKWTKTKIAIVVGAVAVVVVGTVTCIVAHHYLSSTSIFSSMTELSDSDNANWIKLTGSTPAQATQSLFDACSHKDWSEATNYWPSIVLKQFPDSVSRFQKIYGGMEVISLRKPFKGRISFGRLPAAERARLKAQGMPNDFEYPGVYVPYEIRLADGTIKRWQLAIRYHEEEHHWCIDGGM
jgi:hypothetical protein